MTQSPSLSPATPWTWNKSVTQTQEQVKMLQEQFPDMHPFVIYSYILEKRHEMAIEWFERNGLDSTSLKHHHLSWYMLKNIPAQNEIDSWLLYTLRDMANDDDEEEQSE